MQEVARTRPRSRPHPKVNAAQCLEFAQVVRRYGGTLSVHDYATELGHSSPTQGSAIPKISSPQYFGFFSRDQGSLRGTDLLDRLSAPISPEEEQAARLEAINNVEIYGELFNTMGRSGEKRVATVRNMAQRQLGIIASAAAEFVDVFVESIEWAGLGRRIDEDRFVLDETGVLPAVSEPGSALRAGAPRSGSESPVQAEDQAHVAASAPLDGAAHPAMPEIHVHIHIGAGDPQATEDCVKAVVRALRQVSLGDK